MVETEAIELAQLLLDLAAHVFHYVEPVEDGGELAALFGVIESLDQH